MPSRPPVSVPFSLSSIVAPVEKRIGTLLDSELNRWAELDRSLVEPLRSLRRLIEAGGKRLRPAFCHWAFVGTGGDPEDPRVIDAGAAVELLHAFALAHDDVMDGSETRRGVPTTHVTFQRHHEREGWHGEPRRFGEAVAVLAGNLAHVYADLLVVDASDAGTYRQVTAVWHELGLELNFGQYLDVLGTARADRNSDTARRINRYKSGKYTIERPLHLGAALTGRLDVAGSELSAYGAPLGEAFQLRDDVLGAFGDEALTGKPVGEDLREGKPTLLLAVAGTRASSSEAAVLDRVGSPDLSGSGVADVQDILVATGALAEIEQRIADLTEESVDALGRAALAPDARDALEELAYFIAARTG